LSDFAPRVSIGLPVYNGENYLEEAIRSVLAQSFSDFELIISDNASTDGTSEICRDYAATDARVRYSRNDQNLGGARNLNRVWELSLGTYFKWLAHDDRLLPPYVGATVRALESDPDAVLCNSLVEYIGKHGERLGLYRPVIAECSEANPAQRMAPLILRPHTCVDVFGMMRKRALKGSLLHQPFRGSDRALLAQMALRGRLLQIDEVLVQMRQHPNQYSQMKDAREQLAWYAPARAGETEVSILKLYRVYRGLIETERLSEPQRRACRLVLRQFWLQPWTVGRLIAELLSALFPRAPNMFRMLAIRLKLTGAPEDFIRE
jgi:glycosyltransferase involved in cell wall biosynthesis